jgi:DNA-binding protein H-NS
MSDLISEIRTLAGTFPVDVLEGHEDRPILRLTLPERLYYDSSPEVLLVRLKGGFIDDIVEAVKLMRARGWQFVGGPWLGPFENYRVVDDNGENLGYKKIPWPAKTRNRLHLVKRVTHSPARDKGPPVYVPDLDTLAQQAARKSLKLISAKWLGAAATYYFETSAGQVLHLTPYKLGAFQGPADKLKKVARFGAAIEPGYELMLARWKGELASYPWKSSTGEVVHSTLATLKRKSLQMFISPADSSKLENQEKADYLFTWILPDGTSIDALWVDMGAILAKLLPQGEAATYLATGFSTNVRQALKVGVNQFEPGLQAEPEAVPGINTDLGPYSGNQDEDPVWYDTDPSDSETVLTGGQDPMATLDSINARIQKLQNQADALKAKVKLGALDQIRALMQEHDLTLEQLENTPRSTKKNGINPGKATRGQMTGKSKLSPKYLNPKTGDAWSGQGRPPAWIANVKDRSRFLVEPDAVANGAAVVPNAKVKVKTSIKKASVPAKYRDPASGVTWSGRGSAPAWIRDAEDRSPFLITV